MTKHRSTTSRRIAALVALALAAVPAALADPATLALAAGPWYR